MRENVAILNDIKLHYIIAGEGYPVVLIHGWPETWREWQHLIEPLSKNHTVIVPDLRGAGLSDKPNDGYSKYNLASDIYQLITQLGYDKVDIVGHDIGAMVGFAFALNYTNSINKLILLDALMPGYGLEELMDVAKGGLWHFGFHMVEELPEFLIKGKEYEYLNYFFNNLSYRPEAISETTINEYVTNYAQPGAMKASLNYYKTLFQDAEMNTKALHKNILNIPVLAYGGEYSVGNQLLESLSSVVKQIKRGMIPNAGHFVVEENPSYVLEKIEAFLDEKV